MRVVGVTSMETLLDGDQAPPVLKRHARNVCTRTASAVAKKTSALSTLRGSGADASIQVTSLMKLSTVTLYLSRLMRRKQKICQFEFLLYAVILFAIGGFGWWLRQSRGS
jgi:hypothetical protein